VAGVALGLALAGGIVLWERGVFEALWTGNRYAVLGALLNFSSEYRATAMFPELHTGGEAFDTYLVLAAAIASGGALTVEQPALRALCLGASALGLYAVVATFSRGLYAGYAFALLLMLGLLAVDQWRRERKWRQVIFCAPIAVSASLVALVTAYQHGGYRALATGIALGGTGVLLAHLASGRAAWVTGAGVGLLVPPGTLLMLHTFLSSRYSEIDPLAAIWLALGCCALLAIAAGMLGGRGIGPAYRRPALLAFAVFATVGGIGIPVVAGYFMTERLATVATDANTRQAHWAEALRLMDGGWTDTWFGAGMGSFPRKYFVDGVGPETKASYRYGRDADGTWLDLGAGDFNLTQKVPLNAHRQYELALDMRSSQAAPRLSVKLCPKLILFSSRWTPNCKEFSFRSDRLGEWVGQLANFDSGSLGADWPFAWPVTIQLQNGLEGATVQVTHIRIAELGAGDGGGNMIENGDFARGGDHWIMISDFEHLAWHIKNLYLELYFETGLLGTLIFLVCVGAALIFMIRETLRGNSIAVAFAGALAGFCVVGVVGSLLDNPRPAFLFFILLFWSLHARVASTPARH
jgi:hypothetical protein